jgi:hypothetical protein
VRFFGARRQARELANEVQGLRSELSRCQVRVSETQATIEKLGLNSALEAEEHRLRVEADIARREASDAARHEEAVRALDSALQQMRTKSESELHLLTERGEQAQRRTVEHEEARDRAQRALIAAEEEQALQEVGLYEFRHPLRDAVAYREELDKLKTRVRSANRKDGGAISATTNWTVNGSAVEGRRMVRDFSKLMLRAYNAEVEALVKNMKPYKLPAAIDRLNKTAEVIERLCRTMDIRITHDYHALRIRELELTSDYAEKLAREKEQERDERARLREEAKAQAEIERERAKVEKEREHKKRAAEALRLRGDIEAATRLDAEVRDLDAAIQSLDYRAANVRAGYVYVISNLGSFGERMVKIGMTRRLEPLDRVRELGDASVPFRFDVHALFFADDAVGIENSLHKVFAERRVNLVNLRREFFYATPEEVRRELLKLKGDITQFEEIPEAPEFRQSSSSRTAPAMTSADAQARGESDVSGSELPRYLGVSQRE